MVKFAGGLSAEGIIFERRAKARLRSGRPGSGAAAFQAGQPGQVAGRGIQGVTSKSTETSIKLYNGMNKYNQWAFIAMATSNQPGQGAAGFARPGEMGPPGSNPGAFGTGGPPGFGPPGAQFPGNFGQPPGTPGSGPPGFGSGPAPVPSFPGTGSPAQPGGPGGQPGGTPIFQPFNPGGGGGPTRPPVGTGGFGTRPPPI